jgi:hypothetical protein
MVIAASIYLRFYTEVGVGVGTFLPTPTPPKIPSDSDSTALDVCDCMLQSSSVYQMVNKHPHWFRNLRYITTGA